ncbi:MAG: autotransporter outer membrane beta-barrel domain-containing protein [Pseudomonadota bacterium]
MSCRSPEETEAAVEVLAQSRGRSVISNTPDFSAGLATNDTANATADATAAAGVFSFDARLGALGDSDYTLWTRGGVTYVNDDTDLDDIDTVIGYLQVGLGFRPTPRSLIGLMIQGDLSEQDADGAATADGVGFLIGPYGALQLSDFMFLDAAALVGRAYNTAETSSGDEADYDSDRLYLTAKLSGRFEQGQWRFKPALRGAYYVEQSESFRIGGVEIDESTDSLGQVRLGGEIGYDLYKDERVLRPFIGVEGVYSFANGGSTVDAAADGADGVSASLSGGVEGQIGAASLEGRLTYDGLGDSDYSAYGGSLMLVIPLN